MPFQEKQKTQWVPEVAPLVLVNGDKGGPGKSFMARVLKWRLDAMRIPVVLFDGDERNGHLDRFYGSTANVTRFDARTEAGWTVFFNALDQVSGDTVALVDLPSGVGKHLHREAKRLIANQELGMTTVHVWVADHNEDSVRLFKDLAGIAPAHHTAFVMNRRLNEDLSRFSIWSKSKTRAAFISSGGIEASLPPLAPGAHDRIAASQLPFPHERPEGWLRGDWFTCAAFRSDVDEELQQLFALINEVRP